ncbi:MAG TPA: hypothetical protein VKO16_04065 [Polyangia bacterium]|nr:hypothetical protein [Polyangia bacterium]
MLYRGVHATIGRTPLCELRRIGRNGGNGGNGDSGAGGVRLLAKL